MPFFRLILVFIPFLVIAQDFNSQWTAHYSFNTIGDFQINEDVIYSAADNAVFIYDITADTFETITTVNGLSGERISSIYHSSIYDLIFVGYNNGTIEVVFNDRTVRTFVDIVNKPTIPPNQKIINQFYEYQDKLFIATGFGIIEFNLDNIEFGDTFFIGPEGSQIEVSGIAVLGDEIFVSTPSNGLFSADVNSANLVDFNSWNTLVTGEFLGVYILNNQIAVWQNNNTISTYANGILSLEITYPTLILDVQVLDNSLIISSAQTSVSYDQTFVQVASINSNVDNTFVLNTSLIYQGNWYLGTQESGLLEINNVDISKKRTLSPEGPLSNNPFAIQAGDNSLWVVYGDYTFSYNPFPLKQRGISRLKSNQWINISNDNVLGATSLSYITISPNDPEEVFISSFQDGLLRVKNNVVTDLYNSSNSGFETIVPGEDVVRLNGSVFNSSGDLWVVNPRVNNGLKLFDPETTQTTNVDLSEIIPDTSADLGFSEIELDRSGNVFFGTFLNGIIGYRVSDGRLIRISGEGEGANLPSNNVQTIEIDQNNQIWVGTSQGIRVIFNATRTFDESNPQAEQIIILDDEGVPQELLFDQFITDIEVDGANNKWVATSFSGVFYLSADGQETFQHFTTANSPLPSNNVLDITIDDSNGAVFFATEKGLLEFKGVATGPSENLDKVIAFPNPVRPGYNGLVTIRGLTARANVKITDIEGNLVYEKISDGGSIQWDTTAFGRHKVASGVYLILITGEDATETTVSKLLIVR